MQALLQQAKYLFLISLAGFFFTSVSHASDLEKEKRWSSQIVDSLMVGDAVRLKDTKGEFLGLYAKAATPKVQGAAIILHGIGVHPNWPDVIFPLRTELPERGWTTLSIQMPILKNEATLKDYIPLLDEVSPRIDAAVKFLKDKNFKNIVLVSHSLGASMGTLYMSSKPDAAIRAFVVIGLGQSDLDPRLDSVTSLAKITTIPVLDLYGSQDLEPVTRFAEQRAAKSGRANKKYQQKEIAGANHFFVGMNEVLVKTVYSWLTYNAPGIEIRSKK